MLPIAKKDARKLIFDKLSIALAEYKDLLKEKRFTTNLKKISKLLATDIARASEKLNGKLKKKQKKEIKISEKQREQSNT